MVAALSQLVSLTLLFVTVSSSLVLAAWTPPTPTERPLCWANATAPSNRFNSTARLQTLRDFMKQNLSADWYLETGLNRMLSSAQPSEKFRTWISGYTGSSGQLLITSTSAYLFTDTRYTVQADQELDCNWNFYDSVSLTTWVASYKDDSPVSLAVDARQIRALEYNRLVIVNSLVTLNPLEWNPVDALWTSTDRPKPAQQDIYPLPLKYTNETWQTKVDKARAAMLNQNASMLAITGLDETAYLLNLRATVLANVPYFPSMVLLSQTRIFIFLDDPSVIKSNEVLRAHFNLSSYGNCTVNDNKHCPTFHPMTDVRSVAVQEWQNTSTLWLDDTACSYSMLSALLNYTLLKKTTSVQLAKAIKNPTEQAAFSKCSLMDSAALAAFLSELEKRIARGDAMTEISASDLLRTYRAKLPDFRGLSFESIAASGPNAAVVHYRPANATNRQITKTEAFLLDSGGQYLGCTTDVTRTLFYGSEALDEVKDAYTRVLMGVIDLFNLTWPAQFHTRLIDVLARHNLWAARKDYGHGTGHGIGLFLAVHEGPNGIGRDWPLTEGNFQSIEPGYYQREEPGKLGFGIRLETLSGVKAVDLKFLRFEPVTWVPFERKLIKVALLNADQLRWLNWYHNECRSRLTEALKEMNEFESTEQWLKTKTDPIEVSVKSACCLKAGGWMSIIAAVFLMVPMWRS